MSQAQHTGFHKDFFLTTNKRKLTENHLENSLVVPEVEDAALGERGQPLLLLVLLDLLPDPVLTPPATMPRLVDRWGEGGEPFFLLNDDMLPWSL